MVVSDLRVHFERVVTVGYWENHYKRMFRSIFELIYFFGVPFCCWECIYLDRCRHRWPMKWLRRNGCIKKQIQKERQERKEKRERDREDQLNSLVDYFEEIEKNQKLK